MSLQSLFSVLAPPQSVAGGKSVTDWDQAEADLGIRLPQDYKAFIDNFGAGQIDDFIWVFSPSAEAESLNLMAAVRRHLDVYRVLRNDPNDHVPFPLFPEPGGLLPWGVTDNGDVLFWLTYGHPDEWSVVVAEARAPQYQRFDMSATEFLAAVLTRSVVCRLFPHTFPSARPLFRGHLERGP